MGAALVLIALWILAMATGWWWPYALLDQALIWLRAHPWESMAVAAFCLLLGLLLFTRQRPHPELSFTIPSKWGEVRVSQAALQEIVVRSSLELSGVHQVYPDLQQRADGLQITVASHFEPEVVLPDIAEEIQAKVKQDVERYAGIRVAEVKVLVKSFEQVRPARVR